MKTDVIEASVQSVVHTPGPWVVRKRNPPSHGDLFGFHIGNSEHRTTVCEVVNEHDAKLIAAAPMMLAACMDVAKTMEDTQIYAPELAILRAAIRQAVGEQV